MIARNRSNEAPKLEPKVTVVIPAYNYGRFLARAIESVLRQTYPGVELLVVDDGSTDDTGQIVQTFIRRDSRVRYVYQRNAGLSAARNTGIRGSRTPFVAFLDADDEWEPKFLEQCIATMERLPEGFGLVACGTEFIDHQGNRLQKRNRDCRTSREILRGELVLKNRFAADAVLVRRVVFDQCGLFDESLRSSEDRDMWIRIASRRRIHFVREPLVLVRRHDRNMSSHSDRMRSNMRKVLLKVLSNESFWSKPFFWLRVWAYFYVQNAWMLHDEGREWLAVRDMALSLGFWPCFFQPSRLDEPLLFRVRGLARFLAKAVAQTLRVS